MAVGYLMMDQVIIGFKPFPKPITPQKTIGTVTVDQENVISEKPNAEIPSISGEWQYLFKPFVGGNYLNDHCIYKDGLGNWRIIGITSHSQGDYQQEQQFAVGVSQSFPPVDKLP